MTTPPDSTPVPAERDTKQIVPGAGLTVVLSIFAPLLALVGWFFVGAVARDYTWDWAVNFRILGWTLIVLAGIFVASAVTLAGVRQIAQHHLDITLEALRRR